MSSHYSMYWKCTSRQNRKCLSSLGASNIIWQVVGALKENKTGQKDRAVLCLVTPEAKSCQLPVL